MRIGIIGSGSVGGTLGQRWSRAGHTVIFGSRRPEAEGIRNLVAAAGPNASSLTLPETARTGEVLLLATPWAATREAVQGLGDLAGKILLDATNPILPDFAGLEFGATTSGGEQIALWARGARVVKIFNSVGFNVMSDPVFGTDRAVLFYCGDDAAAKQTAGLLAGELGFEAVDAGDLKQARYLEPFAMLWISLALVQGLGREIGFKLLRR